MATANHSINATIQYILEVSKGTTESVGQQYTIVSVDLAVVKKAYATVWQNQTQFSNFIVRIGVFHTTCSVYAALGK